MILPDITSPLRPVIAAFYKTSHRVEPDWSVAECTRTLKHVLTSEGLSVESASLPALGLVVEGRIGIAVLPSAADLTDAVRQHIRQVLAGDGAPEVALIVAFTPRPRLMRVNAPRRSETPGNAKHMEAETQTASLSETPPVALRGSR
jgi:hypothetical protein